VMVAISASVHPAIANRVTAVPRKSWNVTPITAARFDDQIELSRLLDRDVARLCPAQKLVNQLTRALVTSTLSQPSPAPGGQSASFAAICATCLP